MQTPPSVLFAMQRSEHSLCLAWQAVIVAADTGPAPSKSVSEVTPAKTTDETSDCRVNAAIGRLNISISSVLKSLPGAPCAALMTGLIERAAIRANDRAAGPLDRSSKSFFERAARQPPAIGRATAQAARHTRA
jgi:hypothetical protein